VPSERQLKWHELEVYGMVNFSTITYYGKEWGFGDEEAARFNPTEFDARQIVRAAKTGGLRGLIIDAKHHGGFCLWPSKFTDYSVKNCPWKNGKGDVVREFADACRKQGIKFGVYLSPWDRNHAEYGRAGYVEYYKNQIRELLTGYGPIFQISFVDFAGGDGYYGGQGGRRSVGYWSYYDWNRIDALVHEVQPNCMAIGVQYCDGDRMIYGDGRWSGSSAGDVGDPCWSTIDGSKTNLSSDDRKHGCRTGAAWCGAATCVSLRPNWFYRASQDNQVMQPERLMNVYLFSVGRGANLIVNLSPDRRGRLHDIDVKSLQWFGQLLADTFGTDLAKTAKVSVSNIRGQDKRFGPESLIDGNPETYWATDDGIIPAEAILEFEAPITFTTIRLREYLPLGQRIDDWALDVWNNEKWEQIAEGSAIGACRLVRGTPHTTAKVRLRITKAAACPALTEFGLFFQPFNPNPPKLSR
jgi:alpha-L-fucosidase